MRDRIALRGLRVRGFHGVLAVEREQGQDFVVDAVLHVDLLETLAERLARTCLADPRVGTVEVTVHKPSAPVPLAFDDVSVTVVRDR